MQKIFFFFLLSISISVKAQTSVYHPFPDSNAVWIEMWTGGLMPYCEYFSYTINGDTILGSNIYHKLYLNQVVRNCDTTIMPQINTIGYKGCIRQNISTKKIYFIPQGDTAQKLLYNFSLQIGDTVNTYTVFEECNLGLCTVSSIDSVLVGTNYRKQWAVADASFHGYYIIEGIGNKTGLLERYSCMPPDAPQNWVMCYQQDSISLYAYSNDMNLCNLMTTGSNNILEKGISFILSPNPFHNFINIKNNQQKDLSITIFSSIGEVVQQTTLIKNAAATINLSGLAAGIYLVTARSDKNFAARKIIKE